MPGSERIFRERRNRSARRPGALEARQVAVDGSSLTLVALIGGPLFFTWGALVLFLVTTRDRVLRPLARHAPAPHPPRLRLSLWLERMFVYLGTLVGMAGPYGMIRQHDIRDWAQRKPCAMPICPPLGLSARRLLAAPLRARACPPAALRDRAARREDRFYRFIERTWMAQQLPWAVLFFAIGGVELAGLGHRRAGQRRSPGTGWSDTSPTTGRPRLASSRAPACRAITSLLRPDQHGRGLAQQPSRLPGLGALGLRRRDRSRLVADQLFAACGLSLTDNQDAGRPARQRPGLRRLGGADNTPGRSFARRPLPQQDREFRRGLRAAWSPALDATTANSSLTLSAVGSRDAEGRAVGWQDVVCAKEIQSNLPAAQERRRFQRVKVHLLGRYMLPDRASFPARSSICRPAASRCWRPASAMSATA